MKTEIGESLLYSWLRHSKGCQLVQMNWKPSSKSWNIKNEGTIQKIMEDASILFSHKYDYHLFKGTTSLSKLLQQAEIDVLGMEYIVGSPYLFAIDVAFHEAGLNYGSKAETANRVAKNIIQAAMCLLSYFDTKHGDLIFASPKINPSELTEIMRRVPDIQNVLNKAGLNFRIRIIANKDFDEKILQPVIASSSLVADTSELFMRSIQMYNLFSQREEPIGINKIPVVIEPVQLPTSIKVTNRGGLDEMKIGVLVKSTLSNMLANHEITKKEIELMETAQYSKEIFDIQYPLLKKTSVSDGRKISRYWAGAVESYGETYFICSEWFEVPENNDRPYFMKWLAMRQ